MVKLLTINFFLISFSLYGQTQEDSLKLLYPLKVDSIFISGNEITEEFIITRELTFGINDTIDFETADYNRERIYSLGIFNQVALIPFQVNGKNVLNINVEESWYIYPIPFVNIKERDWKKLSFGAFLVLKNFRGRNETLSAVFAFGYDPSYSLSYYNPNSIGNENIFLSTRISYSTVANKSSVAEMLYGQGFEQKVINTNLEIGRRFDLFHRIALQTGYSYIETPFFIDGINASGSRIDRVFSLGAGYQYDTRDLIQFPKQGLFINTSFIQKGLGINDINYSVASFDLRNYHNIAGKLHFKWRIANRSTFGDQVPYYDNSIIGLENRIRGFFFDNFEGMHLYLASAELYHPVIEELKINLDFIPIIPKKLLSYRFGLYVHAFADAGAVHKRESAFGIGNFKKGYGAGFTVLILPYYAARAEIAINEYRRTEFIFDVGISF